MLQYLKESNLIKTLQTLQVVKDRVINIFWEASFEIHLKF